MTTPKFTDFITLTARLSADAALICERTSNLKPANAARAEANLRANAYSIVTVVNEFLHPQIEPLVAARTRPPDKPETTATVH